MIRRKEEERHVVVEVVDDVTCDKCGKSCLIGDPADFATLEYATLRECWGFLGGDFDREHHLCRECTKEIIATFKHQADPE